MKIHNMFDKNWLLLIHFTLQIQYYRLNYRGKFTGVSKLPTRIPRSISLSSNFLIKGWLWKQERRVVIKILAYTTRMLEIDLPIYQITYQKIHWWWSLSGILLYAAKGNQKWCQQREFINWKPSRGSRTILNMSIQLEKMVATIQLYIPQSQDMDNSLDMQEIT